MKKLIIISVLFAALVSISVWEIVYSSSLYHSMEHKLVQIEQFIKEDGEEIDTQRTLLLMDKLSKQWNKGRNILVCFGNHNTLRVLDEKISSLAVMIKINHVEDAKVTVEVAKRLVEAISNDTYPVVSNLF